MDDLEVRRLVERAQKFDPDAIGAIYDLNFAAIYRYFRHRVREPAVAEDLTSQLFIKMMRALPDYRLGDAPFRSWLFGIARNLVADYFRREVARSVPLDNLEESVAEGWESPLLAKDLEIAVQEALSKITPDQREVILLRFFADLTHREIARLLEKSEAAVKMLQKRALVSLGERLGGGLRVER